MKYASRHKTLEYQKSLCQMSVPIERSTSFDDTGRLTPQVTSQSLIAPKRLTITRLKYLGKSRFSLLRALEYEVVNGLTLTGKTLDIGGGKRSDYMHLLHVVGTVESVNIDSLMEPTYILDLNNALPLPEKTFDNIISLNTFEHVYQDVIAINEAFRVLKPSGHFYLFVPFLYKIHASPNDFHRHTASWWGRYLTKSGANPSTLRIEPLVVDPLSSCLAVSNFGGRTWLRVLILCAALLRHSQTRGERLSNHKFSDYALGWYLSGTKG